MTSNESKRKIIEQAAAWHARLAASDVSSQDWQELEEWLAQGSEHREVFESMERMSGALRSVGDDPMLQALHDSAPGIVAVSEGAEIVSLDPQRERRAWKLKPRQMALAASVLVALMVPLLYYMGGREEPEATNYATAVGERRSIDLDDGSSLTLNTDSSVAVTLTEDGRQVTLWRGDLYVEVAEAPERPFTVGVGDHRVTVTGTTFDVRYRDDPARVTVHEGQVRVALAIDDQGSDGDVDLRAGQQLTLTAGAVPIEISEEDLAKDADWRNGWLHFEDATLAEVVRELEPYLDTPIVLTSRQVAALKVGGSFNVDSVDSMLTALETLLPIQVVRESDRILIRHASDETSR